jgi:prepilin peptidase CpaA
MVETAVLVIFPFCMVFAAMSDLISMTIANHVSLLLVGAFILFGLIMGMPLAVIAMHVAAGAAVLTVAFALFAIGGMGGGDAKLMAATAVWLGFNAALLEYLATSALLGGALTLMLLAFRRSPLAAATADNPLLRHCADARAGIPYGVALGIGGLLTYTQSPLVQWALARL